MPSAAPALLVLTVVAGVLIVALAGYRAHDILTPRQLTNAVFGPAPTPLSVTETFAHIWSQLRAADGASLMAPLLPTQSGVLWLFTVLVIVIGLDVEHPAAARNVDLAALVVTAFLLYDCLAFLDPRHLADPATFTLMDVVFGSLVAVSLCLLIRAVWWSRREATAAWTPNLPRGPLVALALLMLLLDVGTVLVREPDDAGFYTNLGAQRLRERGEFPYGDPLLTGSAGAGYGPVLFLAHLPFQFLLDPHDNNAGSPDHPPFGYRLPPAQATQLTTLAFHLIGVAALFVGARRLAGHHVAWALVALYCGSAFVLGVGGTREMVGGMTFISHMAPTSIALLAFALLDRPLLAGVTLALSVATVFAPVYFVPAWLGYYWRDRAAFTRFVAGLLLAAVVVGGPVLARSRATPDRSVLGTVLHDTIGHHQGSDMYGQSPFGFWGQRTGVRAALRNELVPGLSVSSPIFALATLFAAAGFVLGRGRSPRQLAALTAAMGIAAQLWKIHGTGVYVNWYYPFLLLGILATSPRAVARLPHVIARSSHDDDRRAGADAGEGDA